MSSNKILEWHQSQAKWITSAITATTGNSQKQSDMRPYRGSHGKTTGVAVYSLRVRQEDTLRQRRHDVTWRRTLVLETVVKRVLHALKHPKVPHHHNVIRCNHTKCECLHVVFYLRCYSKTSNREPSNSGTYSWYGTISLVPTCSIDLSKIPVTEQFLFVCKTNIVKGLFCKLFLNRT